MWTKPETAGGGGDVGVGGGVGVSNIVMSRAGKSIGS